jgi:hypothetical protein
VPKPVVPSHVSARNWREEKALHSFSEGSHTVILLKNAVSYILRWLPPGGIQLEKGEFMAAWEGHELVLYKNACVSRETQARISRCFFRREI